MGFLRNVLRVTALGATAGIAWSRFRVDHSVALALPVPSDIFETLPTDTGHVALHRSTAGNGEPVLLIHSVNAAASSYEMSPLFKRWKGSHPVVAMDLPGFGFSDRGDLAYTPEGMASAIVDVLAATGPAHVCALSLGSEFAARAAVDRPDLFRSLTLISPTGLSGSPSEPMELLGDLLRLPVVGQVAYDLLVTKPVLRYFLNKSTTGAPENGLVEYAYHTAHQPGARFAPAAFLAGTLFTENAAETIYEELAVPTLVLHDEDPYTDFKELPDVMGEHVVWRAAHIPETAGLPQFEALNATGSAIEEFWTTTLVEGTTTPRP
jgi:pimeloyl-ACP methyl ester carboxylesterase